MQTHFLTFIKIKESSGEIVFVLIVEVVFSHTNKKTERKKIQA